MQLHATRKLFARLPLDDQGFFPENPRSRGFYEQAPLADNPLGGWHGNLVILQRRNNVLLVHDLTRFALVLPALTKPDFAEFNDCFADALMNTLLKCGAEQLHLDAAHQFLRPLQVDTQCSRSVQGTLNQMKGDLEHLLWHDNLNIAELTGYRLGAWLSDRPCTVKDRGWLWPQKEMLTLLAGLADFGIPGPADADPDTLPDNVVSMQAFRDGR